jgi:signal peptidase II
MINRSIYKRFFLIFLTVFVLDQIIKYIFVSGYRADGECISLILVYNKGVAFSMGAFLQEWLKYIQFIMISGIFAFVMIKKEYLVDFTIPAGLLIGSAYANLIDRFIYGGVVDYVYWHCGFDFAVFNFADVMIDLAVVLILIKQYKIDKSNKVI